MTLILLRSLSSMCVARNMNRIGTDSSQRFFPFQRFESSLSPSFYFLNNTFSHRIRPRVIVQLFLWFYFIRTYILAKAYRIRTYMIKNPAAITGCAHDTT